jgi:CDP-diacylglycerol--glycerol-3-phosphate 3-phosphatidyltransferase
VSFARFRREPATHAFLSKIWGLMLFAGLIEFLFTGSAGPIFYAMIGMGLASQLDVIAILLLLPRWTSDVPSAWHAWRLRRGHAIRRFKLLN